MAEEKNQKSKKTEKYSDDYEKETCNVIQTHVHEFLGSTEIVTPPISPPPGQDVTHNHRFAGVTGPVKPRRGSHVHVICINTDFFFNHFHRIEIETGPAIPIFDNEGCVIGHVHAFNDTTSCDVFHDHDFRGTTLIQNPIDF